MTDKEITEQPLYTPEELEAARLELAKMPPEEYIALNRYLKNLELQATLPEAGGTAWADMYSPKGLKINLTSRNASLIMAAEELLRAVRYLHEKHGFAIERQLFVPQTPPPASDKNEPLFVPPAGTREQPGVQLATPVAPPEPTYVPVEDRTPTDVSTGLEVIPVKALIHTISRDGKSHYVKALGGRWSRFGANAYEEVIPKTVQYMLWPPGVECVVPQEMAYMTVESLTGRDGKVHPKVVAFSSHA